MEKGVPTVRRCLSRNSGMCRPRLSWSVDSVRPVGPVQYFAEGYERWTVNERLRFLRSAKGSCGECWTRLLIGQEAQLLDAKAVKPLVREAEEIAKMLHGLIKHFQV